MCTHLASTEPWKSKDSLRLGHVGSLRTRAVQNILSSGQDWLLRRPRERRIWIWRTLPWHLLRPHLLRIPISSFKGDDGWVKEEPPGWVGHSILWFSRAHFHSPFRKQVSIRMQGDPSCPSGIATLRRAVHGTKDAAQCFDSYCERMMEKLDYNIGVFNPCLCEHPVKDVGVRRHGDDFATLATRTQIAEFKEDLSNHSLVKHIGSATTTPWRVGSTISEPCATRWVVHLLERRQSVLKSKLTQDTRNCWSKFLVCKQTAKGWTHQESVRERVHAQSNFHHKIPHHTVPMSCDSRTYQLSELKCSLQVKNQRDRWRKQQWLMWQHWRDASVSCWSIHDASRALKDKKLCPSRSRVTATQSSTGSISWNLRQQHRRLSASRVLKLNSTQQSKKQLRE